MPDVVRSASEYIATMWKNLTAVQRFALGILVALLVAMFVWLFTTTARDDMVRLIGPEEALEVRAQVKEFLEKKGYFYELRDEAIYVKREQRAKIVLELAGEGLFTDKQIFKFLEEAQITATRWQQDKRWQVALQRKLEQMIRSLRPVRNARVQITPGSEAKRLGFKGEQAKASVIIQLFTGKELTPSQVNGIASIIAASVPQLRPANVKIMDTRGKLYRIPIQEEEWLTASDRRQVEQEYEKALELKVLKILEPLFQGVGEVYVAATVKLSSEKTYKKIKEIKPEPVEYHTERYKMGEKSTTIAGAPGIKGAGEITPGALVGPGLSVDKKETKDLTKSIPSHTFIETSIPPGVIAHASIAVAVAFYVEGGSSNPEGLKKVYAKEPQIKELVQNATGIKSADVKVQLIPIKRTPEVIPEPSTFEKISLFLDRYGGTLLLSIFAFVALFLIHGIIKKTLVKVRHIPAEELKKVEEEPIITEAPPEKELFRIREAIKSMVNRNPRAVAGIIRKWTFEK